MPKKKAVAEAAPTPQPKPIKVKEVKDNFEAVCQKYKLEYRPGVTRYIDLAKKLGVNYEDGMSLEDITSQL